jgi:peptide/nickel transport system permease protein
MIAARPLRWAGRLRPSGKVGLALVLLWALVALLGPLFAPYSIGAFIDQSVFSRPSAQMPLGSDYLGRDVLSRLLSGARYTVGLGAGATIIACTIGTSLALTSAVGRRVFDEAMSRFMDAFTSIPSKILALVMVAAFGSSLGLLLLVTALTYVPGNYRIARSLAVNLNQMDFVQVARARGEPIAYIAVREILPNMIHPLLADLGLRFVFIVLLLSALSFLGLGVQPPNADLGSLVRENMSGIAEGAPAVLVPALAIASLTIGVNLLIDALKRKAGA